VIVRALDGCLGGSKAQKDGRDKSNGRHDAGDSNPRS
jgi:hypothetical protein